MSIATLPDIATWICFLRSEELITFMLEADVGGPSAMRASTRLHRAAFEELVAECQRLASIALFATFREESEQLLRKTGRLIQGLIPETIMTALRAQNGAYIRIASNIHVVPFELAFDDTAGTFLGEANRIGRIQVSEVGLAPLLAPEPSILLVGAGHAGGPMDLPEAAAEFEAISDAVSGWGLHVTRLSGSSVTREDLARTATEQEFQLLHFSGHGVEGAEGHAGLVLADGFISFEELAKIVPSVSIVVFSACSSGRGLNEASRLYFQRGASAVVGFVGPVTDIAGREIATRFYGEIGSGKTLGDALRIAKTAQRYNRPEDLSWASLVLFGDPTGRVRQQRSESNRSVDQGEAAENRS